MTDGISQRIRQLRKEAGLTQQDVARALQVGQSTIANYENGTRLPDPGRLVQFADLFQVSVDHLLGREEEVLPEPSSVLSPQELYVPAGFRYEDYWKRLMACDGQGAMEVLRSLRESGEPLEVLYSEFLERALKETGTLWERGDLPVWKEHCISQITLEAMAILKESEIRFSARKEKLLALVPGAENHSIGLKMISDQLEQEGFQVIFLGSHVPADNILQAIIENRIRAVLLSLTMPQHVDGMILIIEKIKLTLGLNAPAILVGGQAFAGMSQVELATGADKYCRTYADVIRTLRRIW